MSTSSIYLRQLLRKLFRQDNAITNMERVTALDLTLKVMALLATADGRVDDAEIKLARDFYAAQAGNAVSDETIRRAIENVAAEPETLWRELSGCDQLSESLREEIYLYACKAASADGEVHEAESVLLDRIGDTLGITAARRSELVNGSIEATSTGQAPLTAEEIARFSLIGKSRGGEALKQIFHRFNEDSSGLNAELCSVSTDLLINAMALMCLSDSTVDEAELRLMGEIFAALGSSEIARENLQRSAAIVASDANKAWLSFDRADSLDEAMRRDILRATYQIAQIDGKFDPLERALLERLAACLKLPAGEIELLAST